MQEILNEIRDAKSNQNLSQLADATKAGFELLSERKPAVITDEDLENVGKSVAELRKRQSELEKKIANLQGSGAVKFGEAHPAVGIPANATAGEVKDLRDKAPEGSIQASNPPEPLAPGAQGGIPTPTFNK